MELDFVLLVNRRIFQGSIQPPVVETHRLVFGLCQRMGQPRQKAALGRKSSTRREVWGFGFSASALTVFFTGLHLGLLGLGLSVQGLALPA